MFIRTIRNAQVTHVLPGSKARITNAHENFHYNHVKKRAASCGIYSDYTTITLNSFYLRSYYAKLFHQDEIIRGHFSSCVYATNHEDNCRLSKRLHSQSQGYVEQEQTHISSPLTHNMLFQIILLHEYSSTINSKNQAK